MKIVSLSPSFTEILEAIGAIDSLAAITDHCPEITGKPRIGSPKALKIPEIIGLHPDIVLGELNENRPEEIRELQKNVRVTMFDVRSVEAVLDAVSALGRLAGKIPEAQALIQSIGAEADKNREISKQGMAIPTLILLWNIPYLTVNFDTYPSRLVEISGGFNVFHQDPLREFPVDLEDLVEKNPECLILPGDPFPFVKRHVKKFREYRGFAKIPIEIIDGKLFSRFGPRTAEALRVLREIFLEIRDRSVVHFRPVPDEKNEG